MTRSLFSRFLPVLSVAALSSAASAHVQAFKYFDNLVVFGSSQAESVTIAGTSNNMFVIGNHGALVNGQAQASFTGIHGSVLVELGGGNDGIALVECDLEEHLILLMGSGNDSTFVARNTIAGSVLIEAGLFGTYDDLIVMNDPFDGGNVIGGHAIVIAKRTTLFMRAQEILGSTQVFTGSGNDLVTLAASNFHGNVRVDTDGGVDHVAIGDAADVVPNLFGGRLEVRLGSGNDRLTVRRSTVSGQARLMGEAGTDVVESAAPPYGNVFQASLQFTGFETTL